MSAQLWLNISKPVTGAAEAETGSFDWDDSWQRLVLLATGVFVLFACGLGCWFCCCPPVRERQAYRQPDPRTDVCNPDNTEYFSHEICVSCSSPEDWPQDSHCRYSHDASRLRPQVIQKLHLPYEVFGKRSNNVDYYGAVECP